MLEEVPVTTPFTEGQASGPEADSSIPSHSVNSSDSASTHWQQHKILSAFYANVLRAHQTKFTSTTNDVTPRQERLRMWYLALKKKKQLVQQLLETQRLIEDVEQEAIRSQYLTMDTIALYRRRYYDVDIKDDAEGTFISTVSDLRLGEKKLEESQ